MQDVREKDKNRNGSICRLVLLIGTPLLCLACIQSASAFNTEYHAALVDQTLTREHFHYRGVTAAKIFNYFDDAAEKANQRWYIDLFYWFSGNDENEDRADKNMHFDGLDNVTMVSAVWKRLEKNTYYAVKQAERNDDTDGMIAILGMSLHTVQDFYAHSNWAEVTEERNWCDATWFDIPDDIKLSIHFYTYGHDTLNKDYASRPHFETAYREAYYASRQWVDLVHSWVSDDFWERTMNSLGSLDPEFVWHQTMLLNWYAGSWNSDYSQCLEIVGVMDLIPIASNYGITKPYIGLWDKYAQFIASDNEVGSYDLSKSKYSYLPEVRWLKIETIEVRQIGNEVIDIEPGSEADFYTVIDIDGIRYFEAPYLDADLVNFYPTASRPDSWYTVKWITLVPFEDNQRSTSITYSLWDDDFILRGENDQADLVPADNEESWTYTGDLDALAGQHIITQGDDNDYCAADFQFSIKNHMQIPSGPPEPRFVLLPSCGPEPLEVSVMDSIQQTRSQVWKWTVRDPVAEPLGGVDTSHISTWGTFIQRKIGPLSYPTGPDRLVNVTLTVINPYGRNSLSQDITVGGCPPVADFDIQPHCAITSPLDALIFDNSSNIPTSWILHIQNESGTYLFAPFGPSYSYPYRFTDTSQVWLTVKNRYGSDESGKHRISVGSIMDCLPIIGPLEEVHILPDFRIVERISHYSGIVYDRVTSPIRGVFSQA